MAGNFPVSTIKVEAVRWNPAARKYKWKPDLPAWADRAIDLGYDGVTAMISTRWEL